MIAVIDYGVGNLFSVEKALMQFATDVLITGDKELIAKADKLVLPGVGDFGECMSNLEATGLIPTIRECIAKGTPLLGICIGEQILFEGSEESPEAKGLGIFKGMVRRIQEKYKIAGDKPGSGNTENIGSFKTASFDELKDGKGPFSALGQEIFDIYWKYYPKYRSTSKEYVSLDEFLKWYPVNQDSIELLYPCDKAEILNRIMSYIADHSEADFNENFREDEVALNVAEDVTLYK